MMHCLFFLLILPFTLCALEPQERLRAHLTLGDFSKALSEGEHFLQSHPDSSDIQYALMEAFTETGDEMGALKLWQRAGECDISDKRAKRALEALGWGVIYKGERSSQILVRQNALIGGAMTRDARGARLVARGLNDSNAMIRAHAAQLAASLGDDNLRLSLLDMLEKEDVWYVRLEVIRSLGNLRERAAIGRIKELICAPGSLLEERGLGSIALVNMYDDISDEEINSLAKSERSGLRHLAVQMIQHFDKYAHVDLLAEMMNDTSPDVRLSAMTTLGLLRASVVQGNALLKWVHPYLSDADPKVAITAAWVALLSGGTEGEIALYRWIKHSDPELRRLASAALRPAGIYGVKLATRALKESDDLYVRANAAIALIGQRKVFKESRRALVDLIEQQKEMQLMWEGGMNPLFTSLAPSKVTHQPHIPRMPELVDQMTRLELLSMLSVIDRKKAASELKVLLSKGRWRVTARIASMLLEHGDDNAITFVRELLKDDDKHVRTQAAIVLAFVGSDRSGVKEMIDAYPDLDREAKVQVLEALAHVGGIDATLFLTEKLKEPFQLLRVVAASALIQSLNN